VPKWPEVATFLLKKSIPTFLMIGICFGSHLSNQLLPSEVNFSFLALFKLKSLVGYDLVLFVAHSSVMLISLMVACII